MNTAYKIKILFTTLGLALVAAAPLARAQDTAPSAAADAPAPRPSRPKGTAPKRQEPLGAVANLTQSQKTEIAKIREETRAKIEALPDDDNKRSAMRAAMMDASSQIRSLLNDDQKKQYDAAMKKMMRGKKKGEGAPPASAP
jgi:Spy/CpxP family protein refolding chaperone